MPSTATLANEPELKAFIAPLDDADAVPLRTLAHAWGHAGGQLRIGQLSVRLLEGDTPPFTAATIYANHEGNGPTLELARTVLERHGLSAVAWNDWCDEHEELTGNGFDRNNRYPRIRLRGLETGPLLRLAVGLRDIHLAVAGATPSG